MSIVAPPAPRHRRETQRRGRRALLVVLAVAALLLPLWPGITTSFASPGADHGKADGKGNKNKAPVWKGVPGTNLAHDSYGYAWPAAPDCDESNVATSGCVNDGRGFFQGQCTSWVAHRVSQRGGISFTNWLGGIRWGNARDWAKVAKGLGYQRNKVPAPGAIGWYRRGHVSYVEDVNPDGSIVISEMNTDGHNGFHVVTTYPGGAGYPDRFIHVADVLPVDYTAPGSPAPVSASHLDQGAALTWEAPSDNVGVTGYRVLRDGLPLAETTRPRYVDRQASRGQSYAYSVVAVDAAGNASQAAAERLHQSVPAPEKRSGRLRGATELRTAEGSVVCGRLGSARRPHVGCRTRRNGEWRTVRTGREVAWGREGTRAFVASPTGTRVWFCRQLPGSRNACLPLDLRARSWGFDRIDRSRKVPTKPVWVASRDVAGRCGLAGDRPSCSTVGDQGWKAPLAAGLRPGDPLSRAFVATRQGVAFCRVVDGRAVCTTFDARRRAWRRTVEKGHDVSLGRWYTRRAGPTLCVAERGGCRVVS